MAAFRASGGSEAAFEAFLAWTKKNGRKHHDPATARARWEHYRTSPPTSIGVGTLIYEARRIDPTFGTFFRNSEKAETKAGGLNSSNSFLSSPEWPKPLATVAFHGLAGEIVAAILPHTEADPVAILLQFLASFGNAVGRGPYFPVEGDRHTTNLHVLLIGQTSKARKGTSSGRIRQIFDLADHAWSASRVAEGDLSSGEGLIWQVRDPIERTVRDKKTGAASTEVLDEGVHDKRLLVLSAEFASTLRVMQRDGNTLSAVVRQAWNRGNLRSLTKNSPAVATDALISIVGHITADELRRYLDRTETANGFGNRLLFGCVRRSKCLPEGGGQLDLRPLAEKVARAITVARSIGSVCRDNEARALWREIYPTLSEEKPGLLGALTGRAEAQVTRLSLLYALLDGQSSIKRVHLEAALEL